MKNSLSTSAPSIVPPVRGCLHSLLTALCLGLLAGCGPSQPPANTPVRGDAESPWSKAKVDSTFTHEWEAWKLNKWEAVPQEQRDAITRRGTSAKDYVDQSYERVAAPWKDELKVAFAERIDGYRALLDRLERESHPNPQRERTVWFDSLVIEVSKRHKGVPRDE